MSCQGLCRVWHHRLRLKNQEFPEYRLEDAQIVNVSSAAVWRGTRSPGKKSSSATTRRIFNICYRFAATSDDAQDLTQEVFIKMYRTLNSYDVERGAFMTWVTTMTRNLLVDHFRKAKQDRVIGLDLCRAIDHEDAHAPRRPDRGSVGPPDARVQSREAKQAVHQALQKAVAGAAGSGDSNGLYRTWTTGKSLPFSRFREGTVKSRINRGASGTCDVSSTYLQAGDVMPGESITVCSARVRSFLFDALDQKLFPFENRSVFGLMPALAQMRTDVRAEVGRGSIG